MIDDSRSLPSGPNAPVLRAVLLTGATGSLGGRLCAELLDRTSATVYCLIRAADRPAAEGRLHDRLEREGVLAADGMERVISVPGDLDGPGLGMSRPAYDALADSVHEVWHCAASVNLTADYARLAPVNVDGTRHALAFAEYAAQRAGRPVPFRFISTLGTLLAARDTGLDAVDESTTTTGETSGPLGYPLSKATAEQELRAAGAGAPVTFFRPGVITGDWRTGRTSESDLLIPLLKAAVALGSVPADSGAVPADTIDTVVRAIVELARTAPEPGAAFHLVRPRPLSLDDVFDAVVRAGHHLTRADPRLWWEELDDRADDPAVHPLAAMREVTRYMLSADPDHRPPQVHSDRTWAALTQAGVSQPPLDADYLDRLIAGLIADGTLPAPTDSDRPRRRGANR
ncbi:hypothetical protein A6A06_15225 [Streptomyces sp. CB02923]|uniref:SDR family oxidoreductase n=1 Tax=Streptomyces sp. CB02923 TaxID=1718985 RepID=UPI00093E5126|nr:SDR family oxidoreductase [Streptomyces sp. CB02923]OKI02391.1 hypothetical protein A6A06_15225 [Streptomyces sp. CB02923]